MILVVGATGLVGQAVCLKLAERGEAVRALVRETSSADRVAAYARSVLTPGREREGVAGATGGPVRQPPGARCAGL